MSPSPMSRLEMAIRVVVEYAEAFKVRNGLICEWLSYVKG